MIETLALIALILLIVAGACWAGRDGDTHGKAGDSAGTHGGAGWGS